MPQNIQLKGRQKLLLIDAATEVIDLKIPPGNRLEELQDDRIGQHSIRINDQWRICFIWKSGDAFNVEIVHGKRSVTADTALRLGRFFGMSAQFWLNLQSRYDLGVAEDALKSRLKKEVHVYQVHAA